MHSVAVDASLLVGPSLCTRTIYGLGNVHYNLMYYVRFEPPLYPCACHTSCTLRQRGGNKCVSPLSLSCNIRRKRTPPPPPSLLVPIHCWGGRDPPFPPSLLLEGLRDAHHDLLQDVPGIVQRAIDGYQEVGRPVEMRSLGWSMTPQATNRIGFYTGG